jgi:predicted enzyme related to lactoylglutathione lyase
MNTPIVFFDIAGPDLEVLAVFYRNIFGWEITPHQRFPQQSRVIRPGHVSSPLSGSLRKDPPQTLLYLGVADITATLATIAAHGGAAASPRLEIPGVVVLALFTDPAGNRIGLIEMDGEKAKIP